MSLFREIYQWTQPRSLREKLTELPCSSPQESEFFKVLATAGESNVNPPLHYKHFDVFMIASQMISKRFMVRGEQWLKDVQERLAVLLSQEKTDRLTRPSKRADRLLTLLHQEVFKVYHPHATDLRYLMDGGHYNCLSASILFSILAEELLGLRVQGVEVRRHVFCQVWTDRGWVDVEPTMRRGGVDPDGKVLAVGALVPRVQYQNRASISLLSLIGLIYTNHLGMNSAHPTLGDCLTAYRKARLLHPTATHINYNLIAVHSQLIQDAIQKGALQDAVDYIWSFERLTPPPTSPQLRSAWIRALTKIKRSLTQKR